MPIIFLTAAIAGPEQPFLGYEAGAADYLAKRSTLACSRPRCASSSTST